MKEFFSSIWARISKPFRWLSEKLGGPTEKRNLLGYAIDFVVGVIKLPFKFVWGVVTFGKKLFTSPKDAWEYVQYQGMRICNAILAIFRIRIRTRDGYRNDVNRVIILFWVMMIGFVFVDVFVQLGWILAAKILFGGGAVVFLLSGIPNMFASWKEFTFEQWQNRRSRAKDEAQTSAILQREADASAAIRAANEKEETAERLDEIARKERLAKLRAAVAEQKMVEAKASEKADQEKEIRLLEAQLADLKNQPKADPGVTDAVIVD